MAESPRILFVCDAGPMVGGGHVMRSLTLARSLAARGAACAFKAAPAVSDILRAFAPDVPTTEDDADGSVLVFDHYGLQASDHRRIAAGRPVVVIDDLANRPLGADLVVDPGPARRAADYAPWIDARTPLLLGAQHALVRPEFAALREATLRRRNGRDRVEAVLVSLGLTDVGGVTGAVVERLRALVGEARIDVVVGEGAPSLPALIAAAEQDKRVRLHRNSGEMAQLIAGADLGVGAGGSSTWERAVLGLPSILLVLAANQRPAGEAMTRADAALVSVAEGGALDPGFDGAVIQLMRSVELRRRLTLAGAALCDGLGADRVAEAVLALWAETRNP